MLSLLVIASLIVQAAESWKPASDYCQYRCIANGKSVSNLACTFYKCASSTQRCSEVDENTNDFRQEVLHVHNAFRNDVAKGLVPLGKAGKRTAANMNGLNYDFELEHLARCLANKCSFGNRCLRSRKHDKVGTNVLYLYDSEVDNTTAASSSVWAEFAKHWWEKSALDLFDSDLIGKYEFKTQEGFDEVHAGLGNALWATTTSIGCARSTMKVPAWLPKYRLVCTYAPGTAAGQVVFKEGKPCAECPEGGKCGEEYDGLCGRVVKNPVDDRAANARTNFVTTLVAFLCSSVFSSIKFVC